MLRITQEFNKISSIKYNSFTKFKTHLLPHFIVQCFKLVELQIQKKFTFKHCIYKLKHCLNNIIDKHTI